MVNDPTDYLWSGYPACAAFTVSLTRDPTTFQKWLDSSHIQAYSLTYAQAYANFKVIDMSETERHVRLFRNGRNQALRIPREFELEGEEAILRKEGDRLIIEPVHKGRLLALLASLEPLTEEFPDIDEDLPQLDEPDL